MGSLRFLLPAAVFAVLVGFFVKGLYNDPRAIPSVLIDRPVPEFSLAAVPGLSDAKGAPTPGLSSADLKGKVSLVNVFGSWCVACVAEHPYLMVLRRQDAVPIYGIDWREKDPADGRKWLQKNGNPYTAVGLDPDSRLAIDFGVTGAPETFVVDQNGVIRYKHVGPVTEDVWMQILKPLVEHLKAGGKG